MQTIKSWLAVVFSAALIGTLARIAFFLVLAPKNLLVFSADTPYFEILKAFLLGFRFDVSAVCHLTLLFWLVSLLFSKKMSLSFWKFLLSLWAYLLIVDIGYFSFYNDRINVLIFGIFEDDTMALIKTFWKNYPVLWILLLTFLTSQFLSSRINKNFAGKGPRISSVWTRGLALILLLLGARGTFGLFPLGEHDTVISSVPFLNTLSYGTGHAISRAVQLKIQQQKMGTSKWNANLKEFGYLDREDQAFKDFFQKELKTSASRFELMKSKTTLNLKAKVPPHVVLIVMESWGQYGLQFQNKEFDLVGDMKKYFQQDLVNFNFLSATPATTGSLSCLLSGLPQRTISPFLTESDYLQTSFSTSPALQYKKYGYSTHFIYGGNPGWRDMNKFAMAQGFQTVSGDVDIEKKIKEQNLTLSGRHDWGLFDQDVFKYLEILLKESTTPQLIVVMTTTNHPPFDLPKGKKASLQIDDFPEKELLIDTNLAAKRFAAFRYSSDSLAYFLDQVKANIKLKSNSIIAATADHTFWVKNFTNEDVFMKSAVPFFISMPEELKKQISLANQQSFTESLGSHQDIWPTLYELSLATSEYESFGRPLWFEPEKSFAFNLERLIFKKDRGVFVTSAETFSSLLAKAKFKYAPTTLPLDADQQLAQKYRALMGALDSYLYHSKMTP